MSPEQINTDIDVLREMVRLAENRRTEELEAIERLNRYNLALIAFSGSFLSLLVTTNADHLIVRVVGLFLILSIIASLIAIRPTTVKGGAVSIDIDVANERAGKHLATDRYLLEIADITSLAANTLLQQTGQKRKGTIIAAFFLALSLFITYILYAYA